MVKLGKRVRQTVAIDHGPMKTAKMAKGWPAFVQEMRSDGGWRIVLASALGYGTGLTALPFYTLGTFAIPLEEAFGWSRAQVQASLVAVTAATLAGGWLLGWLIDLKGVRRVALVSQLGLGAGLLALSFSGTSLVYWYAVWFLMALIGLGTGPIAWTRGIAGWFDGGRGLALALTLTGSGFVALFAPFLTQYLITNAGWRIAYVALAAIVLASVPVTVIFYPRASSRPTGPTSASPAQSAVEPASVVPDGLLLSQVLRGFRFWVILAGSVFIAFAMGGLIPNIVPLLVGKGLSPASAAAYIGLVGITIIPGRLLAGYALDRLWAPAVACLFLPLSALSCFILVQPITDGWILAGAFILFGLSAGAEFDLIPYLCTRYFGMRSYGRIYALQWTGFSTVAGMAPAIFGWSFDVTGSYAAVLQAGMACFLVAPLLLLLLGQYRPVEFR